MTNKQALRLVEILKGLVGELATALPGYDFKPEHKGLSELQGELRQAVAEEEASMDLHAITENELRIALRGVKAHREARARRIRESWGPEPDSDNF
jgi:hypothetical protein